MRSKRTVLILLPFLFLNAFGLWRGLSMWEDHLNRRTPDPYLTETPDDLPAANGRDPVYWVWDQPVVADEVVGREVVPPPAVVDPDLNGVFEWMTDRKLRFTPSDSWPAARNTGVELSITVTNRQNRVFAFHHRSRVEGPPLQVVEHTSRFTRNGSRVEGRLRFNAEVDMIRLQKFLSLKDRHHDPVRIHLSETPSPSEFLFSAGNSPDIPLQLTVRKGLPSIHGDTGKLNRDLSLTLKPRHAFRLTGISASSKAFEVPSVEFAFSSPPDLTALPNHLSVEPAVRFSVSKGAWWRRNRCQVRGDFTPGQTYTFRFAAGTPGLSGTPLSASVERRVRIPTPKPGLRFTHSGRILNAAGSRKVQVDTVGETRLELSLYRVHDNNLSEWLLRDMGREGYSQRNRSAQNLGVEVWKQLRDLPSDGSHVLDLAEAVNPERPGVYRLRIRGQKSGRRIERLLVVSDIGLLARRHGDSMLVWSVDLASGQPVSGLSVQILGHTRQVLGTGTTDTDGLAHVRMSLEGEEINPVVVTAAGQDRLGVLGLDRPQRFPGTAPSRNYVKEGHEAFVYTDRNMIRPGGTVRAGAIVRGKGFQLPGRFPVQWTLRNRKKLKVWHQVDTLSDVGTVQADITLPREWPNGPYTLSLSLPGDDAPSLGSTIVNLESFVPPQIVVEADVKQKGVSVPEQFSVQLEARMLYGGAAADHPVKAVLSLLPETFRSSEYPDHVFSDDRKPTFSRWSKPIASFKTDQDGKGTFVVDVPPDKVGRSAIRAVVGMTVTEFSGRPANAFVSRRVDRVPYYLGLSLRTARDRRIEVDAVGAAPDGSRIGASPEVEVEWFRIEHQRGYRKDANGNYSWVSEQIPLPVGTRQVTLHGGQTRFPIQVDAEGLYRIAVRDPATGVTASRTVRVGRGTEAPERADQVELAIDRPDVNPGEPVNVSVHAPFAGTLLLTLEDRTLLWSRIVKLKEPTGTVSFSLPETDAPNVWVRAVVIRPQPEQGAAPVVRSEGALSLPVNHGGLRKPLDMDVPESLRPLQTVTVTLRGEPGAEVVLAGVDEGILRLGNVQTPDPVSWFLAFRRAESSVWDVFDALLPELEGFIRAGQVVMGGGDGSGFGRRLNPVDAKRFKPFAWGSGPRTLNENGELDIEVSLPEFTGKIRWMAVQVSKKGMGHAEAFSTVGRPLVVQQSLPLFLAPGDETDWTLRIQNRSEKTITAQLNTEVSGPVSLLGDPVELRLTPGETRLHRLQVHADSHHVGKADCRVQVVTEEETWTLDTEIAVRPVEAFHTGSDLLVLSPGEGLSVNPAGDMIEGTASREIVVSAMPVALTDAAETFLFQYPYGCIEQTVSKAMPALLQHGLPGAHERVKEGIFEVFRKQRRDGSFGYWTSNSPTSAAGSLVAMEFLLLAEREGHDVNARFLQAGVEWVEANLRGQADSGQTMLDSLSYQVRACNVLALAERLEAGRAQWLREQQQKLNAADRVHAAEALRLAGYPAAALDMLAGVSSVGQGHRGWYSSVSDTADLLRVLIKLNPRDGRIPRIVQELLSARRPNGRWRHTYETASVLRAFQDYAEAYPSSDEPLKVEWVKESEHPVRLERDFGLKVSVDAKGQVVNKGESPVYISITTHGIPREPPERASNAGIGSSLQRPDGSAVKPTEPVKSGEHLVLFLKLNNLPRRMRHLVLDQRLPAGLEPVPFSGQAAAEKRMTNPSRPGQMRVEHLEIRDDRILAFPAATRGGVLRIHLRAVSPGTFRFPAPVVEHMYDPEVYGRGVEGRLEVRL